MADTMYKKTFKHIGRMGELDERHLAKKVQEAQPLNSIATSLAGDVLDLTDIDSDSNVDSISEPEEPSLILSGGALGDDEKS